MFRIFFGLALFGVTLFVGVGVIGLAGKGDPRWFAQHLLIGVFAGIYLCLVHTLAMFHLIGSAKELKDAAKALPEYGEIVQAIRRSKMLIFPVTTFAIMATIATVVMGGGVHTRSLPMWVHDASAIATLALNIYAFVVEYRGVKETLLLITVVDYKIEKDSLGGRDA